MIADTTIVNHEGDACVIEMECDAASLTHMDLTLDSHIAWGGWWKQSTEYKGKTCRLEINIWLISDLEHRIGIRTLLIGEKFAGKRIPNAVAIRPVRWT